MAARSRTTTAAALMVLAAACPELVVGVMLVLIGLPFALGLGVVVGHTTATQSVIFGLTMVLPGLVATTAGVAGAVCAVGLLGCRRWSLRASVAYSSVIATTGLALIIFGDKSTGLMGSGILAVGTVLLSTLPLPSIREDLIARQQAFQDGVAEWPRAL